MATTLIAGGAVIDPEAHVALYLQLAQLLRQDIMAGRYQVGDSLPGENALTAEYGVAQSTARKAVAVLREEGLVKTRKGAGSIIASVPPKITVEVTPGAGSVISVRMPTREERQRLGLAEGVPVISIRVNGRETLYDGSRAEITAP